MYGSRTFRPRPMGFGGAGGAPPRDLLVLLGVIFFTFSLQFFEATAAVPALLRLTPLVWQAGFVWQLATYPFAGYGPPSLWFLLELLMIFWFGRDVYRFLGRRQFWLLFAWAAGTASVAAVLVELVVELTGGRLTGAPFLLMQGQHTVLVILIAGFATAYRNATIYLFFVLPIRAKWFIGLELLFAFMGFLGSKDFAGFVGVCAAVGMTYSMLTGGGLRRLLREWRLRAEQRVLQARLERMKRKRGFRVVKGGDRRKDEDGGGWVH